MTDMVSSAAEIKVGNPTHHDETESEPAAVPESSASAQNTLASTPAVRMRETAALPFAGKPLLLPLEAPELLAVQDQTSKQLVLYDLADASPAGATPVYALQLQQTPSCVALSTDGGRLCIGGTRGGLLVFKTVAVVAAAAAKAARGEGRRARSVALAKHVVEERRLGLAAWSLALTARPLALAGCTASPLPPPSAAFSTLRRSMGPEAWDLLAGRPNPREDFRSRQISHLVRAADLTRRKTWTASPETEVRFL